MDLGPGISGYRALGVQVLVAAKWFMRQGLNGWLQGPGGVPRIVSEDWYVGLGPGPSGTQGQVLRWLWSSEDLHGAHLPWVVLCTCLVSCLT